MANHTVLVTDYAWPDLEIEAQILSEVYARLLLAETGEEAELVSLAPQADAILTCWKKVPPAALDAAPRCRVVARYGIGLDNIPVQHATSLGILVTNVPDFCLEEVSDHALAMLLACARRVVQFARATRAGIWDLASGRPMPRLRGQVLGLVGYGNIARALAPKARSLGLEIIAYTPRLAPGALGDLGIATDDLDYLLARADYVSLHVPLTGETHGLIDARALSRMKATAYLINTSRGAVVNEDALCDALMERRIAGAALDVLQDEPPAPDHPLLALDNVIATPHAAFYSESAIEDLQRRAAQQVATVLRGQVPANVVNPAVIQQENFRLNSIRPG